MTATRTFRSRNYGPAKVTSVTCTSKPICPCEMLPNGIAGLVEINGTAYSLEYNATLPEVGAPVVHGYRLVNTSNYKAYDVSADTVECDCEDSPYRSRQCKHSQAVTQLRDEHKIA